MGLGVVLPFEFAVYWGWIGGSSPSMASMSAALHPLGRARLLPVRAMPVNHSVRPGGAGLRLVLVLAAPSGRSETWLGLPAPEGVRDVLRTPHLRPGHAAVAHRLSGGISWHDDPNGDR
jgi:hypothetical protein